MMEEREPKEIVRVAAVADVHSSRASQGALQPLFAEIAERADVLLLGGDLTDHGLPEEAKVLVQELSGSRLPTIAVLGNHDYESGKADEIKQILTDAGVMLLDGECQEVCGVGFAGTKGFGGGFGRFMLPAWGEEINKRFVQESVDEALKLEAALTRLDCPQRIALLHYAPVRDTVEGEPLELFPFLGSSRLEEPLLHLPITAIFHGHAHHGSPEGRTANGIPVYNVSLPLLRRAFPDRPPYHLLEVRVTAGEEP